MDSQSELRAERAKWAAIANALSALKTFEGWDTYTDQLGQMEARYIEKLVQVSEDADFNRGFVHGLRAAAALPDLIIAQAAK